MGLRQDSSGIVTVVQVEASTVGFRVVCKVDGSIVGSETGVKADDLEGVCYELAVLGATIAGKITSAYQRAQDTLNAEAPKEIP